MYLFVYKYIDRQINIYITLSSVSLRISLPLCLLSPSFLLAHFLLFKRFPFYFSPKLRLARLPLFPLRVLSCQKLPVIFCLFYCLFHFPKILRFLFVIFPLVGFFLCLISLPFYSFLFFSLVSIIFIFFFFLLLSLHGLLPSVPLDSRSLLPIGRLLFFLLLLFIDLF